MHERDEMENERERNEKWVVKFLLEMHEMKNEREREKWKVGGEISARNAWNEKREREREREMKSGWWNFC